ncbi:hypothetical protein FJU30_17045 [Affinibrenneria salicis]|uniref:Uncharacterized protein n=2 Tax=Affinibrenneria salicis TaxID=2590031 RepID=A0A5J5FWH5_9GAMM|nr:hypothetical protein FJU30_17045 [Affinibrenneria salicis]
MIPLGYMAKIIAPRPAWLKAAQVEAIYSMSACVSADFTEWVNCWRHNGYWLFDSPAIIDEIVRERRIDPASLTWLYYEGSEKEFDERRGWISYEPAAEFPLAVDIPVRKSLMGYDIVTCTCGHSAECSPLSCNHLAEEVKVNAWCLLDSADTARTLITSGGLAGCEPGPYRIVAVYRIVREADIHNGSICE